MKIPRHKKSRNYLNMIKWLTDRPFISSLIIVNKKNIFRYGMLAGYFLLIVLFAPHEDISKFSEYRIDDIAQTVIMPDIDCTILKTPQQLEKEKNEAAERTLRVFTYFRSISENLPARIQTLFLDLETQPDSTFRSLNLEPDSALFRTLLQPAITHQLRSTFNTIFTHYFSGLVCRDINEIRRISPQSKISILLEDSSLKTIMIDSLSEERLIVRKIQESTSWFIENNRLRQDLIYRLTIYIFEPNIVYNSNMTHLLKEQARNSIAVSQGFVKNGEKIIGKHERITPEIYQKLISLQQTRNRYQLSTYLLPDSFSPQVAQFIFILSLVILFMVILFQIDRSRYYSNKHLLLLLLLTLIPILLTSLIYSGLPFLILLVPYSTFIILICILTDKEIGLISALYLAMMAGLFNNLNFNTFYTVVITSVIANYSVGKVRNRRDFYKSMWLVPLGYIFCVLLIYLNSTINEQPLWHNLIYGAINGLISPMFAIGMLPVLESLFSITTDITLMELSDLNHPLLKTMALESPGTYNHSLFVGMLAETAAHAIGANPLKAQVGAYFHDIGKINKAEYFIENQSGENKHDKLTPQLSARILNNHVKEGLELAKKNKLPLEIQEIIAEHHGTTLMHFFYKKAQELNDDNGNPPDINSYRYPGPKPRSKEAAIVMLADSIEAASRTLKNPNVTRLRTLIDGMIKDKFLNNELDKCKLTLKDLTAIGESFLRSLIGKFHTRIDYPDSPATSINNEIKDPSAESKPQTETNNLG